MILSLGSADGLTVYTTLRVHRRMIPDIISLKSVQHFSRGLIQNVKTWPTIMKRIGCCVSRDGYKHGSS